MYADCLSFQLTRADMNRETAFSHVGMRRHISRHYPNLTTWLTLALAFPVGIRLYFKTCRIGQRRHSTFIS